MAANVEVLGLAEAGYALEDFATAEGNLRGADLQGASLSGANLRRAQLFGADLVRATLNNADLRYANLHRATLVGARYTAGTKWPKGFNTSKSMVILVEDEDDPDGFFGKFFKTR